MCFALDGLWVAVPGGAWRYMLGGWREGAAAAGVPGLAGRIVAIPIRFYLCGPSETTRAISNSCVM